jgi:acetyl esterase/lipase
VRALILWTGITLAVILDASAQRKVKIPFIKVPDIKYATYPKTNPALNAMDVYLPRMGSNSPVIIYVHGGAWSEGDKADLDYKAGYFTEKGYVFVSVNYRLSPDVEHPVHVQDVANAISWFFTNSKHYSSDSKRIYLMGYSSGAHIAALLSVDDKYLKKAGASIDMIKGVVLINGIGYDIPLLMDNTTGRTKEIYANALGNGRGGWEEASPINFIEEEERIPPMLILYGGDNDVIGIEAKRLAERLQGVNSPFRIYQYPKKSHVTLNRDIGKAEDKATDDIMKFLQEKFVTK